MKVKELISLTNASIDFQDGNGNYKFTYDNSDKLPSKYYMNKNVLLIESWGFSDGSLLVTID